MSDLSHVYPLPAGKSSMGFTARCAQVFKLPGETTVQFLPGLKALTLKDKEELHAMFNASGLPTDTAPNA